MLIDDGTRGTTVSRMLHSKPDRPVILALPLLPLGACNDRLRCVGMTDAWHVHLTTLAENHSGPMCLLHSEVLLLIAIRCQVAHVRLHAVCN